MPHFRRSGQGPTLVLQHGFLCGSAYWWPQYGPFAERHDVIAVDSPGFGECADETAPDSIAGMAAALIAAVDKAGVERFHLVGHSMGGMIAQAVAARHPERLARLVLYGTAPTGDNPRRFETFEQTAARFRDKGVAGAVEDVAPNWFGDGRRNAYFELTANLCRRTRLASALNGVKALATFEGRDRLASFAMPTLVLTGERDRSTPPAQAVAMFEAIPDAQLCIVPGAGHNVHLEKADLFNRVVLDFLAQS